jgi:DNA-binding transcriptional LysR family regulator
MRRLRDLPSLDLLRGFEASARHASFTKAADELFLTQSAVSRQIKALEEQLGVELFRRNNRSLELSEAGRTLFETVSRMLEALDHALDRIAHANVGRPLTVTTTVSFASTWLVPRLPGFRKQHPDVDVRLAANNAIVNLERQQIDLAIRLLEQAGVPPGALQLAGEQIFPVCAPSLLRRREAPLRTPADLDQQVLLHFDEAEGRWPNLTWSHWLRQAGLPELRPLHSVGFSHYEHVIQAAIAGEGVALGRLPLISSLLDRKILSAPFPERSASGREYYVVVAEGSAQRAAVQAFIAWLQAEIGAHERT